MQRVWRELWTRPRTDSFVILPHSKQPLNTLNIAEKTSEENASLRYLKGLCHGCLVHFADRELKTRRRRPQRERQKTIGLMSKTTALHVHHAFLYICLPSLHDYDVKMPNFTFCGEHEYTTEQRYFCFPELRCSLQKKFPTFDELNEME